jgi:Kazal-type serine protease inhibitor domain
MKRVLLLGAVFALFALPFLTTSPVSAAKDGEMCGGIVRTTCDKGLFCEYPASRCRTADLAGKCEKQPEVCTKEFVPVCSCGGKQYGNDCERKAAGAQKDHDGPCEKSE